MTEELRGSVLERKDEDAIDIGGDIRCGRGTYLLIAL